MRAEAATGGELDEGQLHTLVAPELERWKVPGVEVILVRGGEIVFAGGFGFSDVARSRTVTPTTLFHHGSTGKSFTGLLAATLVDAGLLEWDRPVRDYLPGFRLHDPFATERVTIRDLLAHRSGLPRHELMWVANTGWSRAELVERLRHLEPSRDLRAEFQYCNLGYATAGHLMGVMTESSWEEQLRQRVLEPLGMTSSLTSVAAAVQQPDFSQGHEIRDDEAVVVPYRAIDAAAPAGQIISSAVDSARWLLFQAGAGEIDGNRLVSEDAFNETRSIQIPVRFPSFLPDDPDWGVHWLGYGMGWVIGTYRDHQVLWHSGGIDGFSTQVMVVPDERLGVLVSVNNGAAGLSTSLMLTLVDRLLRAEPRPWIDRFHEQEQQAGGAAEETRAEVGVVPGTSPSHALDEFTGEFEHPGYGVLQVAGTPDGLAMKLGALDLTATHRHFDTWMARYGALDIDFPVTFFTDADGGVTEALAELEPAVAPIRFQRTGAPA